MTVRDILYQAEDAGVVLNVVNDRLMLERRVPPTDLARTIRTNTDVILKAVKLERRLVTGEMKIRRAHDERDLSEEDRLTDWWLELLHQYEWACDEPVEVQE